MVNGGWWIVLDGLNLPKIMVGLFTPLSTSKLHQSENTSASNRFMGTLRSTPIAIQSPRLKIG